MEFGEYSCASFASFMANISGISVIWKKIRYLLKQRLSVLELELLFALPLNFSIFYTKNLNGIIENYCSVLPKIDLKGEK